MTTLFVSTTGGHLAELDSLARRVPRDDDELWITHDSTQSRAVLAGRNAHFVPYVGVRNPADVLRCLPDATRALGSGITRAFSTGSGIALGYLPYLAARGVACHYVESAARVTGPSLTGRLLQYAPGVRCYTQYRSWADRRWAYGGNEFDRYRPGPAREFGIGGPDPLRVVVTVGTATEFGFSRLVHRMSTLLAVDGPLARATGRSIDVLWQVGCTPAPGISTRPFIPAGELADACCAADLVICHAGLGSAVAALDAGRTPVLAPRRAEHGEAGEDHQVELGRELERRGIAVVGDADTLDVGDLVRAMRSSTARVKSPVPFTLS